MSEKAPFWETKSLSQMNHEEWESLCDGCGRCCLVLLQDADSGAVWETDVACRLFDARTRRCTDYPRRKARVPACVTLTPENLAALDWMPESCAYRRLHEGRGLADWHPLISGTRESVVAAGVAVSADLVPEGEVADEDLEDHVTRRRT